MNSSVDEPCGSKFVGQFFMLLSHALMALLDIVYHNGFN